MNQLKTPNEIYFSFWSWSLLKDCPQSYYLKVLQRSEKPAKYDMGNAIQGSIPHNQSEDFFRLPQHQRDPNWFIETFDEYWKKFTAEHFVDWAVHGQRDAKNIPGSVNWNQEQFKAHGMAVKYGETKNCSTSLAKLVASLGLHRMTVETEVPFKVVIEPAQHSANVFSPALVIGGRIDLLFKLEDGSEEIWDIKGVKTPSKMDIDQLIFYRMGRRASGANVRRVGYLFLKQTKVEAKKITDAHEMQLRKMLRHASVYHKTNNWPPNYREWCCNYCDVKEQCSAWQQRAERAKQLTQLRLGKVDF